MKTTTKTTIVMDRHDVFVSLILEIGGSKKALSNSLTKPE